MKVIGVTGGVGCGKSAVLAYLEENRGAAVCRLDDVAKGLQEKGGECYYSIIREFGPQILDCGGEIDRGKLSSIVFCDEEKRKLLNALVHPAVRRRVDEDMEQKKKEGVPLYVIESAILKESGYDEICSQIWYIYADEEVRRKRLRMSRGYSDERISRMMDAQPSEEEYKRFCGVIIDNSKDFEDTVRQIGEKI